MHAVIIQVALHIALLNICRLALTQAMLVPMKDITMLGLETISVS